MAVERTRSRTAIGSNAAGGWPWLAVDAAIAAAVLLGIAEPAMTGLGGDLFAIVKPAGTKPSRHSRLQARPAGFEAARTSGRGAGHGSPARCTGRSPCPGSVAGFASLAERHGRLGLERNCLAPANRIMHSRYSRSPACRLRLGAGADSYRVRAAVLPRRKCAAPWRGKVPSHPGPGRGPAPDRRTAPPPSTKARWPKTWRQVSPAPGRPQRTCGICHGPARNWLRPISGSYKGVDLIEHPPNGQGRRRSHGKQLKELSTWPALDPWGADRAHIEAEVTKLAYDARNRFIADPDHMTRLDHLLSQDTADALANLVDPERAAPDPVALSEEVHRDTVYLTVVDGDRMAVSLIYSIFSSFGSGVASKKFGILLQNRGAGFSLVEGHPNEMGPGKRPMHTIIPAMLARGGKIIMPFGVMGGPYQATGHARFLTNVVDYGLSPQEAIDGPRCFPGPDGLEVERGYTDEVRAALAAKGHDVLVPKTAIGGAQAILIDHESGLLEGGSDPRKDGCALGY